MTNYFIDKQFQELKRIENMLSKFPDAGPSPDPDKLSPAHIMLLEERNKLTSNINRQSNAFGVNNPLENTNFKGKQFTKQHSMRVDNNPSKRNTDNKLVSPEERQKACDELEPNGCGGRGFWRGNWVSDTPGEFDFTEACNNHDRRYATLDYPFRQANKEFFEEMLAVPPYKNEDGNWVFPDFWAKKYYNFVRDYGWTFYVEAQKNARICKYGY